ncbi:IclR family transcriptional regulator [Rhodospirillum sp. A1_3_36]|uniref:IclR family transcriptional regulator n=1 Tax=Rhodospirillum sp. A1_3_36 TaxID=3391666 RepID=UPI0039A6F5DC
MTSSDRLLSILGLFTEDQSTWTVEAAAQAVGVSIPTAYRYFNSLRKVQMIDPVAGGAYRLGPAFIEMDRRIRTSDPLVTLAGEPMTRLVEAAGGSAVALLCRRYRDGVMCVARRHGPGPRIPVSYERGLTMPLFRGATSRAVLAYLPTRALKRLYAANAEAFAEGGLGATWDDALATLRAIRKAEVCVSHGQIDPGRVGIASAVVGGEGVVGSLSIVVNEKDNTQASIDRLADLVADQARALGAALADHDRTLTGKEDKAGETKGGPP